MEKETEKEELEEELGEEETSEKTEEEEGETSEKDEVQSQKKEPDWKAKADAMYAKYKEEREKRKELEAVLAEYEKEKKEVPKKTATETEDEWRQKIEFLLEHKDYTEDEYDHIATVAKKFDISLEEAAELEKDYIQYHREKVAQEKKVPEPSSPSREGKKIAPEDIAKMSEEEHRKLFEEDLKKREGLGQGV